jgi:hypothetical protein
MCVCIVYFGEMLVASLLAIVLLAISQLRMGSDAVLFAGGAVALTLAEYLVHRFVLHGFAPIEHRLHHANPDGAVLTIFWQIWICLALCSAGITAGGLSTAHVLPTVSRDANSSRVSFFDLETINRIWPHSEIVAWSTLLRSTNKGRLSWRPLSFKDVVLGFWLHHFKDALVFGQHVLLF